MKTRKRMRGGNSLNDYDETGQTPLYGAVKANNITEIIQLLTKNIDVNKGYKTNIFEETPLHVACINNSIEIVKLLIDSPRIDVNIYNSAKQTPLFLACFKGYIELVKLLLSASGIDVNKPDRQGNTPLVIAVENNHFAIADLLSSFPGISKKINKSKLKQFSENQIVYFVDETNINEYLCGDYTILQSCAIYNEIDALKKVLKIPGINVNIGTEYHPEITPLRLAITRGNEEVVKILLEHPDIDVNLSINSGILEFVSDEIKQMILTHPSLKPSTAIQLFAEKQTTANRSALKPFMESVRKPFGRIKVVEVNDVPSSLEGIDSLIVKGTLPKLPEGLQYLDCSNISVRSLPKLPSTLRILLCANCNLEALPDLPDSLEYLDARNNRLKDIKKLPPKLLLSPMGIRDKNERENIRMHSANLLLEGNELPIGFLNGYGSMTEYSKKHIHTIIDFEDDKIYTMIIPKGTLLFRDSSKKYMGEELLGIGPYRGSFFNYPEFNVFFYPYPFVAENFINSKYLNIFELTRDVEVLMGVLPSENSRSDRHSEESTYLISCDKIPTGSRNFEGNYYDPCFTRKFSEKHQNINGMFVLAGQDTQIHLQNNLKQRFWSKYRTNFKDNSGNAGVPEIILHPNKNRFSPTSPNNFKHLMEIPHTKHSYDKAWETVEQKLSSGEWTIDLFTKMYVNWNSASNEVKARCVPLDDPYKLRYLNTNIWKKTGGNHHMKKHRRGHRKTYKLKNRV